MEEFVAEARRSVAARAFVKLTLGKYRGPDMELKNVYVRPVEVRKREQLSFLYRYRTRDVVKNLAPEEGLAEVARLLGAEFLSGHLFTRDGDLQIEFNRRREARLNRRPPTFQSAAPTEHDRRKRRFVEPAGSVWLRALGVTNERGEVRERMGDKFRQIDKFVETVAGLYAASPLAGRTHIEVLDMGSGKGYLTFAVYDYFTRALGVETRVTGVEARAELVELCRRVAREAGFERLEFRQGLIEQTESGDTDILIALHACDTATDDALFKGIAAQAAIIITAPCCHKELRPQMRAPAVLEGVLRHGLLLEREAETVTDSLRALLLEAAGYKTKVFEFVSTEHTRKNTMIAGVRQATPRRREEALRQVEALKEFYGIREQRLERLLCELPA